MTKTYAIDFDGTLVENSFPLKAKENVVNYIKDLKKQGNKLILWTCRTADKLDEALDFCEKNDLQFDAINENLQENIDKYKDNSRKIVADFYIDDKALNIENIDFEEVKDMKNKFYEFKNKADSNSTDIFIYGEIISGSEKWDESDVTFMDFKNALQSVTQGQTVNLYINSCGGSVITSQGIVAMLQRAKEKGATINAYIDGTGASCASFIPMCANNIYCYKSSLLMVHHPMNICFGNKNDMQEQIDVLNKIEDSVMMPLYMSKAKDGITEEYIKDLLDKESWLNAEEMSKVFDIEILEEEKELVACIKDKSILDRYKHIPEVLQDKIKEKQEDNKENKDLEVKNKIENALKEAEIFLALNK